MSAWDRLAQIQDRAEKATEGPWIAGWGEGQSWVAFTTWKGARDADDALVVSSLKPEPGKESADAEFIASARADVPALVAALEEALDACAEIRANNTGTEFRAGGITAASIIESAIENALKENR